MVVHGTCGGVGTTTVAMSLAILTQACHPSRHALLVDFDSQAFDVLGQSPYKKPGCAAHRSPIGPKCGRS